MEVSGEGACVTHLPVPGCNLQRLFALFWTPSMPGYKFSLVIITIIHYSLNVDSV